MIKLKDGREVSEKEYIRLAIEFVDNIAKSKINTNELQYDVHYTAHGPVPQDGAVTLTLRYKTHHNQVDFPLRQLLKGRSSRDRVNITMGNMAVRLMMVGWFYEWPYYDDED